MDLGNQTLYQELILMGFSQDLHVCVLLFVFFLLIYTLIISGNSFLICAVIISPQLYTPMYYFLCNLSLLDLCYASSSLPKLLLDIFSRRRRISVIGCLVQMSTGIFLGTTDCILLAVMSYDRYIAIRFPLHYTISMNWRTCTTITLIMWSGSFILATIPSIAKPLVFCRESILDHFLCEIIAIIELACGDLTFYKITIYIVSLLALLLPFAFIVMSYICIIVSILNIRTAGGRSKAFSTCASHLIVVFMYYGTLMTMCIEQTKAFSSNLKYISLIYIVVIPLLNPLIYSLRNNEVKKAFKKILTRCSIPWQDTIVPKSKKSCKMLFQEGNIKQQQVS